MRRVLVTLWLGALLFVARQASAQVAPYITFTAGHYSGIGVGPGTASTQSGGITALGGIFGVYDDFPAYYGRAGARGRGLSPARGQQRQLHALRQQASGRTGRLPDRWLGRAATACDSLCAVRDRRGRHQQRHQLHPQPAASPTRYRSEGDFPLVVPGLDGRLEYGTGQLTNIGNTNHTLQTFSIGLVYRIPR